MRGKPHRIVVDTNVIVSRLLVPTSTAAQAVRRAVDIGRLIVSDETMEELVEVLARPKWNAYLSLDERKQFVQLLGKIAELVPIVRPIRACRDPTDDKFLAAAVNGEAGFIQTGDRDLLVLDPFHGIAIVNPKTFLTLV
jgi:uncharacterized protein